MISQIKEAIKGFLIKWYTRFKIFVYLFATWAVIHSTVSICEFSVAFEYDDGLVYTTDSYLKARKFEGEQFWSALNENAPQDRIKIIPGLMYYIFKIAGFSVDIIANREDINSYMLTKRWSFSKIYFVNTPDEKYKILEAKKYLIFFANSDDGIIQAEKAGIKAFRIKRNIKSLNPLDYNPGKFKEKIIPLSEF